MANWLTPAMIALFSFGLWGLFTKLAVIHIDSNSALVYQTVGVILVGLVVLALSHFRPDTHIKGFTYATLTGITSGLGCLFYFIAASRGKITTVVTLTALYPCITILLSFFLLKESVTLKQTMGIVLALVALIMISS